MSHHHRHLRRSHLSREAPTTSTTTNVTTRHIPRAVFAAGLLAALATTAGAMDYVLSGWIAGGGTRAHTLWVGVDDNRIFVRGTPGRDIDCWVYDANDNLVDSDTDNTATCLLATPGVGTHRLVIRNYDSRGSSYTVSQDE